MTLALVTLVLKIMTLATPPGEGLILTGALTVWTCSRVRNA